jgi:tRNA A-37 threonylcarbamoyl transferase component Bud32
MKRGGSSRRRGFHLPETYWEQSIERIEYIRRTAAHFDWHIRRGWEKLALVDFFVPGLLSETVENNVRIHGFLPWEGGRLFVKLFKASPPTERIKALIFGHKAAREFRAGRYLDGRVVPTPLVLAVGIEKKGERRAILVFQEAHDTESVHRLLLEREITERPKLLEGLSKVTALLHDADFYHRDYHVGNILASVSENGGGLLVIDLHRASHPRSMSGRRGLENIADLLQSITPGGDPAIIRQFLEGYLEHRPDVSWELSGGLEYVKRRIAARERRRLISRTKRCFKDSTEFFTIRTGSEVLFGVKGAFAGGGRDPKGAVDEINALLTRIEAGEGDVVKDDRKARVILLPGWDGEVCVKAYERPSFPEKIRALWRMSRGHRSWRAARGLSVRGFSVPGAIALLVRRSFFLPTSIFLVTDSIRRRGARELDRFILEAQDDRVLLTETVKAAACLLGSMHRKGIYHRDLKATNIAARTSGAEGDIELLLLDLDAVTFGERVSVLSMIKNLSQLHLSIPPVIDGELRRLFFSEYRDILKNDEIADRVCKGLAERVRGEDILYVSPEGDVKAPAGSIFRELFER